MILGSWSHTSSLIHYQFWENKPEIPQYTPNNEWKLLAVTQSIRKVDYPNWVEPDTFFEVNFTILIVRKPLQAIYNTVVPALMLTTLTLVSFFVSVHRCLNVFALSIGSELITFYFKIPFAQEMQIGTLKISQDRLIESYIIDYVFLSRD